LLSNWVASIFETHIGIKPGKHSAGRIVEKSTV
jgi:hypothetical protein